MKKKCIFAADKVKFLGLIVGNNMISPDPVKIEAIRNFPRPVCKRDMRSFLGLINFYRKFAPNFANVVSPFNETLK